MMRKVRLLHLPILRIFWTSEAILKELRALACKKYFFNIARRANRLVRSEILHLDLKRHCLNSDTMIMVGGGPFPYSAFFYRRFFKHIIILEHNTLLADIARAFIKKRGLNIPVIAQKGSCFDYPSNAFILVALLAEGKEEILAKARQDNARYICLRIPDQKTITCYEGLQTTELPVVGEVACQDFCLKSLLLEVKKS